jgi:hypothetical protein
VATATMARAVMRLCMTCSLLSTVP